MKNKNKTKPKQNKAPTQKEVILRIAKQEIPQQTQEEIIFPSAYETELEFQRNKLRNWLHT